jgi:hypothetical protein
MSVTAKSNDAAGALLDSKISTLTASASAAPAGSVQAASLTAATAAAQLETVQHYLSTGRIVPATVISTLSLSASKLSDNANGVNGTNLAARLTAYATGAATANFQQSNNAQLLLQAQTELVQACLAAGLCTPAQILASLS